MNKRGNDEDKLENIIWNTIKKYHLIESNDKIVVAVSGGPDSICLLDYLNKITKVPHFIPEPVGTFLEASPFYPGTSGDVHRDVPILSRNQWGNNRNSCGSCEPYD